MSLDVIAGRVSLIVPCYNVERFISRFFESLLEQTYKQLEVILVEDGSTDGTGDCIDQYVSALEAEGYSVKVIRQKNRGLAGAVDSGLRHVTGEFLTWPDPDDWLTPDSIAARVELFRQFPDAALLRSNARIYDNAEEVMQGFFMEPGDWVRPAEGLFEKLFFLSTFFAPVCHMVRSAAFFELYPGKEIYVTPRASQNLQMLLPLVECFPAYETARSFAVWRRRSDSRSQRAKRPVDLIPRLEMLHDVSRHVTNRLVLAPDLARHWTDQNFFRNKLLPVAFEGRMRERALGYLHEARLSWPRFLAAWMLIQLTGHAGDWNKIDDAALVSPFLCRVFRWIVRFNRWNKRYPSEPFKAVLSAEP